MNRSILFILPALLATPARADNPKPDILEAARIIAKDAFETGFACGRLSGPTLDDCRRAFDEAWGRRLEKARSVQ